MMSELDDLNAKIAQAEAKKRAAIAEASEKLVAERQAAATDAAKEQLAAVEAEIAAYQPPKSAPAPTPPVIAPAKKSEVND